MPDRTKLSIISAAFNEENILPVFIERTVKVCSGLVDSEDLDSYELIIVDDGSNDKTWQTIEDSHMENSNIKGLKLSRNFGQHAAIMAGLDQAEGDYMIYLDSDLQAQPEDIPKILRELCGGCDVAWGVASERNDGIVAKVGSKIFSWFFRKASKLHIPGNAVIGACSRSAADNIRQLREFNRFSLGLWSYVGFKTAYVDVEKKSRFSGPARYNFMRRLKLAISSIVGFSAFPLRLASLLGFVMACVGILLGSYVIYRKLFLGIALAGYASLFAVITFFAGLQFLLLGIIGEYVGIILSEVKRRPIYIVERKVL
jgi:polyisoprenyl-phosphate glycosyltransferase